MVGLGGLRENILIIIVIDVTAVILSAPQASAADHCALCRAAQPKPKPRQAREISLSECEAERKPSGRVLHCGVQRK